ncbi:MAG: MerC domain-containing protein [Sphingopyxis sp.]|nr:MerC domain-containing protein [Sphingopyxis sp.]
MHCLLLPALLVMLPAFAVWMALPADFHVWMLGIAVPTSMAALYIGRRRHRSWTPMMIAMPALVAMGAGALLFHGLSAEIWLTVSGSVTLTIAHVLNRRYAYAVIG